MTLYELKNFIKKQTGVVFELEEGYRGDILINRNAFYDGKDSYMQISQYEDGKLSCWVAWLNNYSGRSVSVENELDVLDVVLKYCKPVDTQLDIFDVLGEEV